MRQAVLRWSNIATRKRVKDRHFGKTHQSSGFHGRLPQQFGLPFFGSRFRQSHSLSLCRFRLEPPNRLSSSNNKHTLFDFWKTNFGCSIGNVGRGVKQLVAFCRCRSSVPSLIVRRYLQCLHASINALPNKKRRTASVLHLMQPGEIEWNSKKREAVQVELAIRLLSGHRPVHFTGYAELEGTSNRMQSGTEWYSTNTRIERLRLDHQSLVCRSNRVVSNANPLAIKRWLWGRSSMSAEEALLKRSAGSSIEEQRSREKPKKNRRKASNRNSLSLY